MNKVVVTGANGFVGCATVKALVSRGVEVRRVVRQHGSTPTEQTVAVGDVDGKTDWTGALAGAQVVIHLVARTHVLREETDQPLSLYRTINVEGTRRLAEQSAAAGVRRLVFVSSIKVNGEGTSGRPFRFDDVPNPEDAYGLSKWEAEKTLAAVCARSGMEAVVVRPPLIYGEGVKGNFKRLMSLVASGFPLPFAMVKNRRSMVALDNLVDLLALCIDAPTAQGRTFLVTDRDSLSTPELIRSIAVAMRRPARLLPVPAQILRLMGQLTGRLGEVERLCGSLEVDDSETRRLLDWRPSVFPRDAIWATVADFMRTRS